MFLQDLPFNRVFAENSTTQRSFFCYVLKKQKKRNALIIKKDKYALNNTKKNEGAIGKLPHRPPILLTSERYH